MDEAENENAQDFLEKGFDQEEHETIDECQNQDVTKDKTDINTVRNSLDIRNVNTPDSNYRTVDSFRKQFDQIDSPEKTEVSLTGSIPMNRLNLPAHIKMVSTEPIFGVSDNPPGFGGKKEFYIYQNIPKPSTPLPVWRGYYGNIYFHPVRIESPPCKERFATVSQAPSLNRCTPQTQKVILNSRWNVQHVESQRRHEQDFRNSQKDYVEQLDRIRNLKRSQKNNRSMLHLDRNAIFSSNANSQDMIWLKKGNSTGTLRFCQQRTDSCYSPTTGRMSHNSSRLPTIPPTRQFQQKFSSPLYVDKRRICHGSVSRKLFELRQAMESSH